MATSAGLCRSGQSPDGALKLPNVQFWSILEMGWVEE